MDNLILSSDGHYRITLSDHYSGVDRKYFLMQPGKNGNPYETTRVFKSHNILSKYHIMIFRHYKE